MKVADKTKRRATKEKGGGRVCKPTIMIATRVQVELYSELQHEAEAEGRTLANYFREIIKQRKVRVRA